MLKVIIVAKETKNEVTGGHKLLDLCPNYRLHIELTGSTLPPGPGWNRVMDPFRFCVLICKDSVWYSMELGQRLSSDLAKSSICWVA